jgi:hypothetical protein
MTLEALKNEIGQLPERERLDLLQWLEESHHVEWEAEIERDFAPGGLGLAFLEELKAEAQSGESKPLEDGIDDRRRRR